MKLFKKREKTIKLKPAQQIQRILYMILGVFLMASSFNLFFLKNNIVYGGVSGISIITQDIIDPSTCILILSIIMLVLSYIFLGKKQTINSILGSLLFPLFVSLTANIGKFIVIDNSDLLLISIVGGVIIGIGSGFVFKAGYTTGGTDILNQIVAKYFRISVGNAMLLTDGLIVLAGGFFFGSTKVLYAMIILYIISIMVDKVVLGISQSKAFYIIAEKESEIKDYLINNINYGVTIINGSGGYSGNKSKVLMCVIDTKDYFKVKEEILLIDSEAFFVVTDAYETNGAHNKKNK